MSTRSCNLDLELRVSSSGECSGESSHRQSVSQDKQQQQQLTIFYNGVMCVCDVSELQARVIVCVASNETREKMVNINSTPNPNPRGRDASSSPSAHYSQLCSSRVAGGGLSMKMSLQKFLQKRKHRSQATHPYHTRIVN